MAERILQVLKTPIYMVQDWQRTRQERSLRREVQAGIQEELIEARVGMEMSLDAGAQYWTDVLRFGPMIMHTPESQRDELVIPGRNADYSDALVGVFSDIKLFDNIDLPPLSEEQLDIFQYVLREGFQLVSDKIFDLTITDDVFFGACFGGYSRPLENALQEAKISVSSMRIPWLMSTTFYPYEVEIATAQMREEEIPPYSISLSPEA